MVARCWAEIPERRMLGPDQNPFVAIAIRIVETTFSITHFIQPEFPHGLLIVPYGPFCPGQFKA